MVLAVLSLGGGYLFRCPAFPGATVSRSRKRQHDQTLVAISVAAGVLGILLAWLMYVAKPGLADSLANGCGRSTRWSTTSTSWMRFTMRRS